MSLLGVFWKYCNCTKRWNINRQGRENTMVMKKLKTLLFMQKNHKKSLRTEWLCLCNWFPVPKLQSLTWSIAQSKCQVSVNDNHLLSSYLDQTMLCAFHGLSVNPHNNLYWVAMTILILQIRKSRIFYLNRP